MSLMSYISLMSKDSWNPQQYEKFKNERSQPFFDLLNLIQWQNFSKVVDLGCGSGELTAILHERAKAKETLGIDNSANMLAKAKIIPGLSFKEADLADVNELGKFDLIFSNAALQWCSAHEELFQKIRNSLMPEGQIAIQMPMNHDYPTHIIAGAMGTENPYKSWLKEDREYKSPMLRAEDYAAMLFKLGFKEQKVQLNVYAHILDSREGVIEWVKGTLLTYYQSRLSAEQYASFLADFRKRLFQQLPDEKPFFYPFKRVLIWAKI